MPLGDVRIDGAPLVPQPSRFIPHPPQPRVQRAINGSYISSATEFGWRFEIIWGPETHAPEGALEEAVATLGDGLVHQLTYTDDEGVTHDHNVFVPTFIAQAIHWAVLPERLVVEALETDQESPFGGGS